jgi:hypothetical protein
MRPRALRNLSRPPPIGAAPALRRARARAGRLLVPALLAGAAAAADATPAPAPAPAASPPPAVAPPAATTPGSGIAPTGAPGVVKPAASGAAPTPGGKGIDPAILHTHVNSLTWTRAVSYDDNGLPTADVRFEIVLGIHADTDCMVDCGVATITSATTDTGEKLATLTPPLEWAQGGDDPTGDLICRLDFVQPATPAKRLSFSGTVRVAPPEAVRVADVTPIGQYLGKWLGLQGLPGGMVHPYLLNDVVWFQFSPQLAAVFHSIHYQDAGGADIDIPDWNDSAGDKRPAYTNGLTLSPHATIAIGYLDQAKCVMLPFSIADLPLDGAPLGRAATPAQADATIPTHPAADPAPSKGPGADHF